MFSINFETILYKKPYNWDSWVGYAMNDKEQSTSSKNWFVFNFPMINNADNKNNFMDIQKISTITQTLIKRYRLYPRRTLIMTIGIGIIISVVLHESLGIGTPGIGLIDKLFICGGLLGWAFGFISPKIESSEMVI
jgi:hypothetical protein